jgi:hypothetical protein
MAKNTDYKKLWRIEKDKNIKIHNVLQDALGSIETYVTLLERIRDGKIDLKEIRVEKKDHKVDLSAEEKKEKELLKWLIETSPLKEESDKGGK